MHSKHIVFAALITIFCAGAVIAAIMGLSEPIRAANTTSTLTPVIPPPPQETPPSPPPPENTVATETPIDNIISSSTNQNDTQTSSTTSGQ